MKKIFTITVGIQETERMEKLLNAFRIGLNDWDKSKIFNIQNMKLVNYTILCEEDLFTSIVNQMNATRVY